MKQARILLHDIYQHASQMALVLKNLLANTGDVRDVDLTPGLGRPPREGNGYPLQYSCLENPMDSGAWWATVQGVAKSQTRLKRLSTHGIPFIGGCYRLGTLQVPLTFVFSPHRNPLRWILSSNCISQWSEKSVRLGNCPRVATCSRSGQNLKHRICFCGPYSTWVWRLPPTVCPSKKQLYPTIIKCSF